MPKKIIRVLGIESSCDETSVSIVEKTNNKFKVLSNIVKSQIDIHKFYGGVVPELAARAHSDIIDKLVIKALSEANLTFKKLMQYQLLLDLVCWGGYLWVL